MNNIGNCWMIWRACFVRMLMVHFALHISHTGGLLQNQYIGCFKSTPSATESNSKDYQLTIQKCIANCVTRSTTYASFQNGTICHCVDDFGVQLPDEACNIICAGNQFEYCGGPTIDNMKSSIYAVSVVYAVCPVGKYGHACDEFCHCKRQIPCDRLTGHCPDGCDENYTGPSCSTVSLREQYIGCFKDKIGSRALIHKAYSWTLRSTLEMCTNACADASYSYAGAQLGIGCMCGESYDKYKELAATKCYFACPGNRSNFCGGLNANSVYSICPVGRYEKGCQEKCNCLNNRRCVYRDGTCQSSQCKPGWTGYSCNIRDCTAYNGDCSQNEICSSVDLKFSKLTVCRCSEGFQRRKMWENCNDKDECSEIPSVCGQNALNCINTIGGYHCLCPNGLTMFNTGCVNDKDECSEIPSVCGRNALNCTTTIGGYQCLCPNGQTMFNAACMTEGFKGMELSNIWLLVGAVGGTLLCVTAMLIVVLVVHSHRRKQRNSESTTSGNVISFEGTTYCTAIAEGSTYATLNANAYNTETYNTDIYEQIDEDNI